MTLIRWLIAAILGYIAAAIILSTNLSHRDLIAPPVCAQGQCPDPAAMLQELQNAMDQVDTRATGLAESLTDMSSRLGSVERRLPGLADTADASAVALSSTREQLTGLENTVAPLDGRLDDIETASAIGAMELAVRQAAVASQESSLSAVENATSDRSSEIPRLHNALEHLPVGSVIPFAGNSDNVQPPEGWLFADGRQVARDAYPELHAVIAEAHGADDAATFRLPDYRGRFLRGVDGGSGRDPNRDSRAPAHSGGNTGNALGSVQGDAISSHRHSIRVLHQPHGIAVRGSTDTVRNSVQTRHWIAPSGGGETRPVNAYVHWYIKAL